MIQFHLQVQRDSFRVQTEFSSTAQVSGFYGPTGCGKTSVLHALAGLLPATRGRIEIGGMLLLDSEKGFCLPPEKRQLGLVFQNLRLFPHLSVRDNLLFSKPSSTGGGPSFDEVIALLDLELLLTRSVNQLSGGQSRLVSVGRALLARPRLLLLDEPMTGLDPALRRRVLAYLLRLKDSLEMSMLLVSHEFSDFLALADEVALLDQGRVQAVGPPVDMLTAALDTGEGDRVETTLSGTVVAVSGSEATVDCSGARFFLTLPGARPQDPVYLTIGAQDVLLGTGTVPVTSARNALPGRVSTVREAASQILVLVNAGPEIWVEITSESRSTLGLEPGREVYLLIKASALRGVVLSLAGEPFKAS